MSPEIGPIMSKQIIAELDVVEIMPGFHGRLVHCDFMTFIYWEIDAGAILPEHSHPHEQVVHMHSGEFEITIAGETEVLSAGEVTAIPSHTLHSGKALTACRIMDAFHPVREDYRN